MPQLTRWTALVGCATVALAIVALIVLQLGASVPWVVAASVLLLLAVDRIRTWRLRTLVRRFRRATGGKDLLVVYTASPHWQPRIESVWMDRWGKRAIFFNRSAPWHRTQPEAQLWAALASVGEHTPLVVLVPAEGSPTAVRFFHPFRDFKHGKEAALLRAEAEVDAALAGIDAVDR